VSRFNVFRLFVRLHFYVIAINYAEVRGGYLLEDESQIGVVNNSREEDRCFLANVSLGYFANQESNGCAATCSPNRSQYALAEGLPRSCTYRLQFQW